MPFKDVSCGFHFSYFVSYDDSELYSCGKKYLNGLSKDCKGDPKTEKVPFFKGKPIKEVACGLNYVCVLVEEGDVYSWGDNTYRQLGHVDEKKQEMRVSSDDQSSFVKQPKRIDFFYKLGIKIEQISCAKGEKHVHTGCLTTEKEVYMWGDPYKGQLGLYKDEKGWTHEENSLYPTPL